MTLLSDLSCQGLENPMGVLGIILRSVVCKALYTHYTIFPALCLMLYYIIIIIFIIIVTLLFLLFNPNRKIIKEKCRVIYAAINMSTLTLVFT